MIWSIRLTAKDAGRGGGGESPSRTPHTYLTTANLEYFSSKHRCKWTKAAIPVFFFFLLVPFKMRHPLFAGILLSPSLLFCVLSRGLVVRYYSTLRTSTPASFRFASRRISFHFTLLFFRLLVKAAAFPWCPSLLAKAEALGIQRSLMQ